MLDDQNRETDLDDNFHKNNQKNRRIIRKTVKIKIRAR